MKGKLLLVLLACGAGLALGCGRSGVQAEQPSGEALVRPTPDPARPTPTRVALPSPTPSEAPKLRARGIISTIDDQALVFKDIDGNELTLKPAPELQLPWDRLKELYQKRERITVVYQQVADALLLVDVFTN
ncbi:MAG: hypothetical protein HY690_04260 [Chloroflexi bacterium]|nr:hypothetical protein [Chloroflexota bacterium]